MTAANDAGTMISDTPNTPLYESHHSALQHSTFLFLATLRSSRSLSLLMIIERCTCR